MTEKGRVRKMTRHFTMYTSKNCAQCDFMRGFLTDLGITYEEIDTDNNGVAGSENIVGN